MMGSIHSCQACEDGHQRPALIAEHCRLEVQSMLPIDRRRRPYRKPVFQDGGEVEHALPNPEFDSNDVVRPYGRPSPGIDLDQLESDWLDGAVSESIVTVSVDAVSSFSGSDLLLF
jgi:hypothetical protein